MEKTFVSKGGIKIVRRQVAKSTDDCLDAVYADIDHAKGCILASDYEFPGRYARWDIGMIDPPVEMISRGREFVLQALNERGQVLLPMLLPAVSENAHVEDYEVATDAIRGHVKSMPSGFAEEERSKQPSVFSILRGLTNILACDDEYLSMFGAFGYDLVFQFEPICFKHDRSDVGADCHLFLADRISVIDRQKQQAFEVCYDFESSSGSTVGIPIQGERRELPKAAGPSEVVSDHTPGEYASKVEEIRQGCRRGDFFEVVLSQVFSIGCGAKPSEIFDRIRRRNPSPYDFLINLGDEQLIGGSPEMFVRVKGNQVETCPISGTVRRGTGPMEDAKQILSLLASKKDESELTMCTDVDRNDKSRVCVPGSVQLVGRRMVETYSRLFHTVDHVKGTLYDHCDMFDAFLTHMWACTLTGAPKPIAMQTIENLENSPRRWYGGCVGLFTFNGQLNTGITIRTIHLSNGVGSVRAGATLLFDSEPDEEERETHVKAAAFLQAITATEQDEVKRPSPQIKLKKKPRVLFVDNQDSFVHMLANYVRQTGAEVITLRAGFDEEIMDQMKPDLVFISPGPKTPKQMGVTELVGQAVKRNLSVFGVCLGHQGIAEYFGAELGVMSVPMHGKESQINHDGQGVFEGVPSPFVAARYHSLYVKNEKLPDCLRITAQTDDGVIMALAHTSLPVASVQFHPESILTLHDNLGLKIIANVIDQFT